jgi:hypothetical protein
MYRPAEYDAVAELRNIRKEVMNIGGSDSVVAALLVAKELRGVARAIVQNGFGFDVEKGPLEAIAMALSGDGLRSPIADTLGAIETVLRERND